MIDRREDGGATPLRERLGDVAGLGCILVVCFGLVSLLTYDAGDVGGSQVPLNERIENKGGLLGAYLAYFLYRNFGLTAYLVIALGGFWAFLFFFRCRISHLPPKLIAAGVLVLCVSTLLSMQPWVKPGHLGLEETLVSTGGIYGRAMELLLIPYVGSFGTLLFLIPLTGVSAVLATDWLLVRAAGWMTRWVRRAAGRRLPSVLSTAPPALRVEPAPSPSAVPSRPKGRAPDRELKPVLPYRQPPIQFFETRVDRLREISPDEVEQRMRVIESALAEFNIEARVVRHEAGPTVTTYEIEPAPGVRISRITGLAGELSMKLAVPNVRIAPLPAKGTVGVEVPNPFPNTVRLREFLEGPNYQKLRRIPLPLLLGKASGGEALVKNLADMPHLLIAGTTGSGKSICLKAALLSLVSCKAPEELKLILIDPKMVELSVFEDIPHLWAPVITEAKKASNVLEWLVKEMEDRYRLFSRMRVVKIADYNALGEGVEKRLRESGAPDELVERAPRHMPYVVVVIDELADLMHSVGKDVENSIISLSQKARAVGIHLVAATQRPSVDVVTGLIKSNMPARISFRVISHIESQIILDRKGAERLLGKGDMLMVQPGTDSLIRAQGSFVSQEEIRRVVDHLKSLGEPQYRNEIIEIDTSAGFEGTSEDELFDEAVDIVVQSQRGSISLLQRRLKIGYQRAARLIEAMESIGVVGPANGDKPREVLMQPEQWAKVREKAAAG